MTEESLNDLAMKGHRLNTPPARPDPPPAIPVLKKDADARCYSCAGPLTGHKASIWPAGRSARQGKCAKCDRLTFYDVDGSAKA